MTATPKPSRSGASSSSAPDAPRTAPSRDAAPWLSRGLLLLALLLTVLFGWVGRDAAFTSPAAPFASRDATVHPLSNPVAPGEAPAFVRPAATALARLLDGARADIPAEASAVERTRREDAAAQRFAIAFHRVHVALLALIILAAYAWLGALLRGPAAIAAGLGALLIAVSPWHAGMAPFVAGLGDLLALALMLWALAAYSVVAPDRPTDMWALAPAVWLCGSLALLASEAALLLVPLMVVVDAALVRRGMPAGMLLRKRFVSAYLPLGLLTCFVVAISPLRDHLGELLGGMPRQALLAAAHAGGVFDRVPFAIPGRDPQGAGFALRAGLGAIFLLGPFFLAWALRRRDAVGLATAALVSWIGAALPGIDPLAATPTVALIPVTFALLALAVLLAPRADDAPASSPRTAAPSAAAPSVASPGWVVLLVVALVFSAASIARLAATRDPLAVYDRAADARSRSPEIDYLAFQAFFRAARLATATHDQQRLLDRSVALLVSAIDEHRRLRAEAPDAPVLLSTKAFGAQTTILLASGRRDQAISFLRDLSRLEPDVPDHALRLAILLFARGDRDEARRVLAPALERPEHAETVFLLAQESARRGDDAAAEELLSAFLDLARLDDTQRARALLARAAQRHKLGHLDGAADDLAIALGDPVTADRARLLLLDTEVRRGRWERVRELARQPGEPAAIPTFRDVLTGRAAQLARDGEGDRAVATLEALVDLATSPAERADAWIDRGSLAALLQRPTDALDAYRAAIAAAPDRSRAYLVLARMQASAGLPADAERTLRDGLALAEPAEPLLNDLASLLLAQARTNEAINLLETFLREEGRGDHADAHRMLGAAYAVSELWSDAAASLGRAVELSDPAPRDLRAKWAIALQKSGEFERAERLLVDLIKEDTSDVARYLEAADLYVAMDDLESAAKILNVGIINTGERNAPLWTAAARVALQGQKVGLAKDSLAKALAADPAFQPAHALRREIADFERRAAELQRLQREAATDSEGAPASSAPAPDAPPSPDDDAPGASENSPPPAPDDDAAP